MAGGRGVEYTRVLLHDLPDGRPDNLRCVALDRDPLSPDTEVVDHVSGNMVRKLVLECAKLAGYRRIGQRILKGVMIFPSRALVLILTVTFLAVFGLHGDGSWSSATSGKMIWKQLIHFFSLGTFFFIFPSSRSWDWVMYMTSLSGDGVLLSHLLSAWCSASVWSLTNEIRHPSHWIVRLLWHRLMCSLLKPMVSA